MPQPIVLGDMSGLAEGIGQAGQAIGQGLSYGFQHRNQQQQKQLAEQKRQQGYQAFQMDLEGAQGDPQKMAMVIARGPQYGIDKAILKPLLEANQQYAQQRAGQAAMEAATGFGGIGTEAGRDAAFDAYMRAGGNPMAAAKLFARPAEGKLSPYETEMQKSQAKEMEQIGADVGHVRMAQDNIEFLRENLPQVGFYNKVTGINFGPLKNEVFAEYENRGKLALESAIHVFNRVGALPKQKLEWLDKNFSISPGDTQEVIKGKINALESIVKNQSEYYEGLAKLSQKYDGGMIPAKEYNKYKTEFALKSDQMVNSLGYQEGGQNGERYVNRLPLKGVEVNSTAEDPDTGETLIFNGRTWVKQRK